jgi:two-component sensor histidine kinase
LQLKMEKNRFRQYFTTKQQSVETNNQARGIYADGSGKVVANIWTHTFRQQGDKMQNVADEQYKYAIAGHQSSLYLGGYNLYRYDDKKNTLTRYPEKQNNEIWSMFSVNDSLLLLGRTNGFTLFNSNTQKFDSLARPHNVPDAKFVYRFFKDRAGILWAVAENGLYKIGINDKRQWSGVKEKSSAIDQLNLQDAYTDTDGIFWLATNGEGLYRWDREANTLQQFNIASGLPSDVLYRIEPDQFDNLWISSDYGLIRFNKKTFAVNTYTTTDGIPNNEFNRTSSFRAADGLLYFGGLDGIIGFNPKDFATDAGALNVPLRVIALNQFVGSQNRLVNETADLLNTSQITLAPTDRFFTLEFQLLDFAKDEVYHYAYKIDGVDKDWNYINENSIRISGLPYGKFTLHVKAQNREGAWSKSELTIPLLVLKPFYLKWWFIVLLAVVLVVIIYRIIKWRTKQLAEEKIRLEQTVSERTAQLKQSLAEQAGLLSEKDMLMKEIHHRVKNNLQVISGLLELQSNAVNDEAAKGALTEGRNRVRSISLIHQNLYQLENLGSIELKRFANDLCRQMESVYKKQNQVTMHIDVPVLYLDIDSAVPLGLIMNELLTNSFKYAFDDSIAGEINIKIDIIAEGKYKLVYTDNGPGLPADFDLSRATTLGLQLIYDLSRQIGGKVKYEHNHGATFIINFTNRDLRKKED